MQIKNKHTNTKCIVNKNLLNLIVLPVYVELKIKNKLLKWVTKLFW
jgi:hypothetical protein